VPEDVAAGEVVGPEIEADERLDFAAAGDAEAGERLAVGALVEKAPLAPGEVQVDAGLFEDRIACRVPVVAGVDLRPLRRPARRAVRALAVAAGANIAESEITTASARRRLA
jgi:hypothetical protein